ncbi:MAG: magnesium and cobalt transport protein [Bdellovibrionaceae bacterium]|nr:magnesium and cobalt transport protein [Pseudobdellovibrionaceae bacterium]
MQEKILNLSFGQWVDVTAPTKDDVPSLSQHYGVPEKDLMSCLDPEHLPKLEVHPSFLFLVTRVFDKSNSVKGDTVQELTTKLAFFIFKDRVITVHRVDHDFIDHLRLKLSQNPGCLDSKKLILSLLVSAIESFDLPLTQLESQVTHFEQLIFKNAKQKRIFQEGFLLKRKSNVFRKVLKLANDVNNKLVIKSEFQNEDFQEIKTTMDTMLFYADEVLDNVTNLLTLYLSMTSQRTNEASYKTNEIVRILTVFSIFFLPLNFLAGVYGMNFENMPELKSQSGYYIVLGVMFSISVGLFIWMYRRGWIKGLDEV